MTPTSPVSSDLDGVLRGYSIQVLALTTAGIAHVVSAALMAARVHGNPRYEATVLQFLAMALYEADRFDASERHLAESLAISRRYGDRYSEATSLVTQAKVRHARGDPKARTAALSALALGREFNRPHHVAEALTIPGELALGDGDHAIAIVLLEEAVELWRTRGWLLFLAAALARLARAYAAAGHPGAAAARSRISDPALP